MQGPQVIAEGKFLARLPDAAEYQPLEVRIYAPVQGEENNEFRNMWTCRCEISGIETYAESFPGVDSLQALEYAQVIAAAYLAQLCKKYDVRRPSKSGDPKEIPLLSKSLLAGLFDGKQPPPRIM
jgi:hypothetical protein